MKRILFFTLISLLISSCVYKNEEELYPNVQCNNENITFSTEISNILSSRCLNCHSNVNSSIIGGGIKLEEYSDVKNFADSGVLLGVIRHESGYSEMPKSSPKLSDCHIEQISIWIENGAKNN